MAEIVIRRESTPIASLGKHNVFRGNEFIGKLKSGGSIVIENVDVGIHRLFFLDTSLIGRKNNVYFDVIVNDTNEVVRLKTQYDVKGDYIISYVDGMPHIPMFNIEPQMYNVQSPNGKNFTPAETTCAISPTFIRMVLVITCILIFISITVDFAPIEVNDTTQNTQNVAEMTDEEKSQCELEKATTEFSEGDYKNALEICRSIQELYPDTAAAVNMDTYIKEQYKQYPSFGAKQLMKEYESNIVNADNEYTGKAMFVTGVVSKIDKMSNGKTLCILLKSGEYFKCVQLNFDTSQTDAVAALREGSNIKVLGRCTGKGGKQLLVFEGENVMIEDCIVMQ